MKDLIVVLLCVLCTACAQHDKGYKAYTKEYKSYSKQVYQGQFTGKCAADGFYYNNGASFVTCSNGNSYVQPCAPGALNSNPSRYNSGDPYSHNDFCDVNLVDYGYTLYHGSSGYGHGSGSSNYGRGSGGGYGYGPAQAHGGHKSVSYGHQQQHSQSYGGDSYEHDSGKHDQGGYGYQKQHGSYHDNNGGYDQGHNKHGQGFYKVEYYGNKY